MSAPFPASSGLPVRPAVQAGGGVGWLGPFRKLVPVSSLAGCLYMGLQSSVSRERSSAAPGSGWVLFVTSEHSVDTLDFLWSSQILPRCGSTRGVEPASACFLRVCRSDGPCLQEPAL